MNYRQIIGSSLLLALVSGPTAAVEPSTPNKLHWVQPSEDSFAFHGVLKRNSADQNGASPYVLVDRWGMVRCYVAPAPDLVLEGYLDQEIGLRGTAERAATGPARLSDARLATNNELAKAIAPHAPIAAALAPEPTAAVPAIAATMVPTAESLGESIRPAKASTANAGAANANKRHRPAARSARSSGVRQAAFQEEIPRPTPQPIVPVPAGEPVPELIGDGGSCGPDCDEDCGTDCGPCAGPCEPYSPLAGLWVDTDYLLFWMSGMRTPPLVTTSSPTADNRGALPESTVVFGDQRIGSDLRSGGRLRLGTWLDVCRNIGIEGEYLGLENTATHFHLASDGSPLLARPFFAFDPATLTSTPTAEIIAAPATDNHPGASTGVVSVNALTRFQAAAVRMRFLRCNEDYCWSDPCGAGSWRGSYRSYLTLGYRFMRLEDRLGISSLATTTNDVVDGDNQNISVTEHDQFNTRNQFHGFELGMTFEMQRCRWSLDFSPRISFGNTSELVEINGSSNVADATGARTLTGGTGGTLALASNIGSFSRKEFSVVPEFTATIGYQVTPRVRATLGYTLLYWSKVARSGDQIDLLVDPNLVPSAGNPNPTAPAGDHPAFSWRDSSFWAQGMTVGLDMRF